MKHIKLQQISFKADVINKFIKPLIVIFFILIPSLSSFSQNSMWAKNMGGSVTNSGQIIKTDASGNVYIAGKFQGTNVDFDPGSGTYPLTSNGGFDIFFAKYDSSGNLIWAKSIGGTSDDIAYSMAVDNSGNVYIAGSFQGTVDFNPGPGIANLSSSGGLDIFMAKYNSSGNYVWAKKFGGSNDDEAYSICVYSTSVYITGYFSSPGVNYGCTTLSTHGGTDIFLAKYDTSGSCSFVKRIGRGSNDVGKSIYVDNSGYVFISGYFNGTGVPFEPVDSSHLLTSSSTDMFIAKYTSTGNCIWARNIGGTSIDWSNSIVVSGATLYVGGFFNSTSITIGTTTLTNKGGYDVFLAKYDTAGNNIWAHNIGSATDDYGYSIATDGSNMYLTGSFSGTISDFTPNLTSNGSQDIFIAKYDASGNFKWAKNFGGGGNDVGNSIYVDGNRNILITGSFTGSNVNFGIAPDAIPLSSSGTTDIFMAKYTQQATGVNFTNLLPTSFTINWNKGGGDNRAVFVKEGSSGTAAPVNGTTYTASTTFKSGTQIGLTGWYCVYNGNGSTVTVTGLTEGTINRAMVCEYTGSTGSQVYIAYTLPSNPVNQQLPFGIPTTQAMNIGFTVTLDTSFTMVWTNGNGTSRAVFLKEGTSGTAAPADSNTYTAGSRFKSSGTQIGATGWYCVYNGTGTTVTITGLSSHTTYIAMVCEYKGTAGLQRYNKSTASNNPNVTATIYSTPTVQASNIVVSKVGADTCTVAWTNGNGTSNVVFVYEGSTGTPAPADNHQYTASSVFKSGEQIGSTGWYCVYYGSSGSSVKVSGLTANTTYRFMVCSFNGAANVERYLTTSATNNPVNQLTEYTTPSTQAGLIRFKNVVDTSFTVVWTNGNGSKRAVFIKANGVTTAPLNHTTYTANAQYGLGSTTAEIWYCIYNGTDTFVNVTGLTSNTNYKVMVFEYNGAAGREAYNKTDNGIVRKTKRLQTITFSPLSDKVFTSSDFSAGANASSGLSITYSSSDNSVAGIIGTDIHIVNVGTCKIYATQAGDDNYMPAKDSSSLTITKAPLTISVDNNSRYYGDANPSWITHIVNLKSGDVISNILISCSATQASDTDHYAITPYDVTFSAGSASNYDITYNPGTLTVTRANLTIAGKDTTRTYGEDNPVFEWQIIGLKNTDSIGSVTLSTSADRKSAIGQYDIIPSNPIFVTGKASNYNINFVKGKLDVTESPIKICLVSADMETGYSMIIWERDNHSDLQGYCVYRQTSTFGVYDSLGMVPIKDPGIFIDSTSAIELHAEVYKIRTINALSQLSNFDQCNYHKSIFLFWVSNSGGVTIHWDPYEIENGAMNFRTYLIYRGTDSTKLTAIDSVASNVYGYTDTAAIAQSEKVYYRVAGVKWTACYPEGHKKAGAGPFSQSVSNMEDNRLQSSNINRTFYGSSFDLVVVPNPVNRLSAIRYVLPQNADVRAYLVNLTGQTVAEIKVGRQLEGNNQFILNAEKLNLPNGMYYLKLSAGNANAISKISVVR